MNDNPENNLMREVDTIKGCQDKMRKTLEQVNHQLGVNRNSRHQLERDLANKDQAISIGRVLCCPNKRGQRLCEHGFSSRSL